jgi:hypothetical protein
MYKITNIDELGSKYTAQDRYGKLIKSIQVIPHKEILEASKGFWDQDIGLTKYLKESVAMLAGFEDIDPYTTLWHATSDVEIDLASIIAYAVKHGYDRVILEHLEDIDEVSDL